MKPGVLRPMIQCGIKTLAHEKKPKQSQAEHRLSHSAGVPLTWGLEGIQRRLYDGTCKDTGAIHRST